MEQFTSPFRRWITERIEKKNYLNGGIMRMSDLNNLYSESITNMKLNPVNYKLNEYDLTYTKQTEISSISSENVSEFLSETDDELMFSESTTSDDLNRLDVNKFLEDLTDTQITFNNIPQQFNCTNCVDRKQTVRVEKRNNKETIILDSFPNPESNEIKIVKVKIMVPRETMQHIDKSNFVKILNDFSNSSRSDNIDLKSCNISNISANNKVATCEIEESAIKDLINKSNNYKPIMGQKALLAKANASKTKETRKLTDSEIVEKLVKERFSRELCNYYEKSFNREISRINKNVLNEDLEFNAEAIQHSSTFINDRTQQYQIYGTYKVNKNECYENNSYGETLSNTTQSTLNCVSENVKNSFQNFEISSICSLKNKLDFNFILSTDDNNVETSSEIYNKSNVYESSSIFQTSDKIEYDERQFLRTALGDEYISTDDQNQTRNDLENQSIGTSNISALVSNDGSMPRVVSMSRKIMNESTTIYEEAPFMECDEYADIFRNNKTLSELIKERSIQNQIITQTSKALNFCKSTKEFVASIEEIEAERILLVASIKDEALKEEINKIEYDICDFDSNSCGSVEIKCINLPNLNNFFTPAIIDKRRKEFTQWFVCVFSHGPNVFATVAVTANSDGVVQFRDEISFGNLSADFVIKVAVYSMTVRNNMRSYSHESKYRLNKGAKFCLSPKFFQSNKCVKLQKKSNDEQKRTSFILSGECCLNINNIKSDLGHFKLSNRNVASTLEGKIVLDITSTVEINEDYSDFLNIGIESGEAITWNKRWCTLDGFHLFYYNYPGEETPIGCLDLRNCLTALITTADRRICPKTKTLFLETKNKEDKVITKHFLSADDITSFKMWKSKLNNSLSALRNWNAMNV